MRIALALLALGACADAPAGPPATLSVRGVYVRPVYDGQAMMVDHEAIPGRMPPMRMAFRLDEPGLLDRVTEGDRVRLTLDSASLAVVGVEPLPAGTDLDLEAVDERGVVIPLEDG